MKRLGFLAYLLGLIPGLLAIAGNLKGGSWTLGAAIFVGMLCVADWFVRDDPGPPPGGTEWTPDFVLALHVVVNTLAVATLLFGAWSGRLGRFRVADAALSTGLNSGLSGIVVAHELIHRRAPRLATRRDLEPLPGQLHALRDRARPGPPQVGRHAPRPLDGPARRERLSLPRPLAPAAVRLRPGDRGVAAPPGRTVGIRAA